MLKKSYNNGIVGLNYLSLIYGIISLKKNKSTLLIDDKNISFTNKWFLNLGHIERNILLKIGETHEIQCLKNIDNYLTCQNTILYLNEKMIELSPSPYSNIKEIARKLPECFTNVYQSKLIDIDQETFDEDFFVFLERISGDSFKSFINKSLNNIYETSKNEELASVIDDFLSFLEKDELITEQLHYVLQVMFQTVFSSGKDLLETKYLLISLISPRYEVDFHTLQEELVYQYRKVGGDMRGTHIKDWGVRDNNLNYILLDAIDGLIGVDQTYYFGQSSDGIPFESNNSGTRFLSISLKCLIDHDFLELFKHKRIIFSQNKRMGSDFPYWEVKINDEGLLEGVYSFADYQGTKPNFYYHHALEDIFQSLEMMLPGLEKADWISRAKLTKGSDIWFEYKPQEKKILHPHDKYSLATVFDKKSKQQLGKIQHCGPNRSKSLGLFSYLLEIFSE